MGRQTYLPIEILDYIETHARSGEEHFGISQRELAKSLGYHPCSMSRPLDRLLRDGFLTATRGLVRGAQRKQLTYRVTPQGVARLRRETRSVPLLGRDAPIPPQPFLGRKDELEQLTSVAADQAPMTIIEGPPGIGKTSLLAHHLRKLRPGAAPYWFTVRPSSSAREFVTGLAHVLSFSGNPQMAYYAQLPREPIAREVADLVGRALERRPLVCVVDDYQFASTDLRKFLGAFAASLAPRGAHQFYIVGQEVVLSEGFPPAPRRLVLGGLDRVAAHELIVRQGGPAAQFERIYQTTLGSPLLLMLAASNPTLEATPGMLPLEVIRQLPSTDFRAVLLVTLANEPLPADLVRETAGVDANRLQDLVRTGVLQPSGNDRVEALEVVRKAVLETMHPRDEREARLALARFYGLSHRPEALRERFQHLVAGEELTGALRLLREHQQVILRLGYSDSLRRAFRHLSAGLPRGPSRLQVLMAEAALVRRHAENAEAIVTLRRVIAEAGERNPLAEEARLGIVEQLLRAGQPAEAFVEFERARKLPRPTRRLGILLRLTEGRVAEARGNSEAAFKLYQEAVDLSKSSDPDLGLEAIGAWSRLAASSKEPHTVLRVLESALPRARRANRTDVVLNLLMARSRAHFEEGRTDLAEVDVLAIRSEAESLGYVSLLAYALSSLASLAIEKSAWTAASGYARQAIAVAEQVGNDMILGYTLFTLSAATLRQTDDGADDLDRANRALVYLERSVEVLGRMPPSELLVMANCYLAEVWLTKKGIPLARKYYGVALALGNQLNLIRTTQRIAADLGPRLGLAATEAPS